MGQYVITVYICISILLAVVNIYFALRAFEKLDECGKYLGLSAMAAAVINVAYLVSALSKQYGIVSVSSSIYFFSIDWLLVFLTHFVILFTSFKENKNVRLIGRAIVAYAAFDTVVLTVNMFYEIAVHYQLRNTVIAFYSYEMKPLYIMHLVFTYILVVIILFILAHKIFRTPKQYKNQFNFIAYAILAVVTVNAAYLFLPTDENYALLDYSIIGYSVGLYIMYWSCFEYRTKDMLEGLSLMVFENMDQGIVLFDYMESLIMHNKRAERMLTQVSFRERMPLAEFLENCEIPHDQHLNDKAFSIQSYTGDHDRNHPLRCDYRMLEDERGNTIGKLFVFSDASIETDLLTGFQRWRSYRVFVAENPWRFKDPTAVAIFDINGLGQVNKNFGRDVGDQRIRNLANIMRAHMPEDSYFVRGHEAHLLALCYNMSEQEIATYVAEIIKACGSDVTAGLSSTADGLDINEAIETAARSLQVKKLLNHQSARSQTLTSLIRALQESDSETEAHVIRTQKMGAALGRRIGLNDMQLSNFSLLCLLHDIGKIGIPLEILNKPGRLSDAEWRVLQSHPEKGYQIALSSNELSGIANLILHHHERWDGKGYPEGTRGKDIPILSRMIAIVDAFDAMINTRSYRRAMSVEKAKQEIRRCAGSQFDPYLAEEFLRMLDENPELAKGEATDSVEANTIQFAPPDEERSPDKLGSTHAVRYSRYLLDQNDRIIETDDAFREITGYSQSDIEKLQMKQIDLIPPEEQANYIIFVDNQFANGSIAYLEHKILKKDGSTAYVLCHGKRYYDSADKAYRAEINIFDVTSAQFVKEMTAAAELNISREDVQPVLETDAIPI